MTIDSASRPAEPAVDDPAAPAAEGGQARRPRPIVFSPGTAHEHARLRALLDEAGFTEDGVRERTGAATFEALPQMPDTAASRQPDDALDALVRLFVLDVRLPRETVARLLPPELLDLLLRLALLQPDPGEPELLIAPLSLAPVHGLLLLSDPWRVLVGDAQADVVYPGTTINSLEFLKGLPTGPCDALLDIGAGTGVAALLGARDHARHAWASDITERSTRVAGFNARLNGLENVSPVEGDLYAAVRGLTFDRIVAHPPYVPARAAKVIFRDGGEDGEQITRGIIEGLPAHLRPGGRFYCRCLATDRRDAPLEDRVRDMLGSGQDAFDVVIVASMSRQTGSYFHSLLSNRRLSAGALEERMALYDDLGVVNVVLAFIAIERHETDRAPLTARRQLSDGMEPDPAWADWLLRWERMQQDPAFDAVLSEARPTLAPDVLIRMSHRAQDGQLRAVGCEASTRGPFQFRSEGPPGLVLVLERCDGTRTFEQLRHEMVELGMFPADAPAGEFARLARTLVGGGMLEIAEHRIPAPAGT